MRNRSPSFALATLACSLGGCLGVSNNRHEVGPIDRSVSFEGCRAFEADIGFGPITVEAWDSPDVGMTAKITAHAVSVEAARRLAEESRIDLKRDGDKVLVEFTPAEHRPNEHVGLDLRVRVPAVAAVTAHTGFGQLEASDVQGPLDLRTGHGEVKVARAGGAVKCRTAFGGITIRDAGGDVNADSGHGGIQIVDVTGPLKCSTGFGSISIDNPRGQVDCHTGHGGIRIDHPAAAVTCKTGFGGIRALEPKAELTCRTGNGSIDVSRPAGRVHANSGFGAITVSEPAAAVRCITGHGNITITAPAPTWSQQDSELRTDFGKILVKQ